jgi:hypothetical protein
VPPAKADQEIYLDPARLRRRLERAQKLEWRQGRRALESLTLDLDSFSAARPADILVTKRVFAGELRQALDARSEERYRHYLRTLTRSLEAKSEAPHSDLNLRRWKEHEDVLTGSLWIIPRRDASGAHSAEYHGNFVPQIPNQLIRRFTREGELVVDLFAGLGTTLIEARRLKRASIGVELDPAAAEAAREALDRDNAQMGAPSVLLVGDSSLEETSAQVRRQMRAMGRSSCQLVVLHPPYHDIVPFSGLPGDLSSAESLNEFLRGMDRVFHFAWALLDPGRFLALVIGDKYEKSRWVPLGFKTMARAERRGFRLKSVVVKNMEGNRAKRQSARLWERRAIAGNFYLFKHEYIFVFEKPRDVPRQVSLIDLPRPVGRRRSRAPQRAGRQAASRAGGSSRRSQRPGTRRGGT